MPALAERFAAMVTAWRDPSKVQRAEPPMLDQTGRYALLWSLYVGSWMRDPALASRYRTVPALYKNARLVWRNAAAIVDCYAQFAYRGDLSTDGKPLPDGTRGAFPIDPQTGADATDAALLRAFAEGWSIARMKQFKALPVRVAAALGDCAVELVDDLARGVVYPRVISPVSVTDVALDAGGNVKRMTIEYPVAVAGGTAYGRKTDPERFWFKKEMDGSAFRYYRDDQPAAFPDWGIPRAVEPNPYGFVPAVWFRHEVLPGQDRGLGALDKTLTAALEMASILSNALDSQHRHFRAPVGVIGSTIGQRGARTGATTGADEFADGSATEFQRRARTAAESMDLLPLGQGGQFVTVPFDAAAAVAMLGDVKESILAENPEASFGQRLLEMSQLTGPGARWALSAIDAKVVAARDNHDPRWIALFQMQAAMMGFRLANGDYPADLVAARKPRYDAFRDFDLTSYGRGLLDCSMPDRPVFPETQLERAELATILEGLQTPWGMRMAGVPEDEIAATVAEKERQRREMAAAFSVARSEPDDDEPDESGNAGGPRTGGEPRR